MRENLPEDFEHSSTFSNFDKFTLNNMHLELEVDFDKSVLNGYVQCDFTMKSSSPYISLDTNHLNVLAFIYRPFIFRSIFEIRSVQNVSDGKLLEVFFS